MLRWLVPENGQPPEKWLPDEQLRQQIRVIVETGNTMVRLQNSDQQISLHQRITFFLEHKCAILFLADEMFSALGICLEIRGVSRGTSNDKHYAISKAIYVYPLRKDFRRHLCHL